LKQISKLENFLARHSSNFSRIESVEILGKGGEAIVFGITPYLPMEVIAKVPLSVDESAEEFVGLLLENHLLKLLENKDYIC